MIGNRLPVRYRIIRFTPSAETGEFANIGVVALVPDADVLDYRLLARASDDMLGFFDGVSPEVFEHVLGKLGSELDRIKQRGAPAAAGDGRKSELAWLYDELTREREGAITFSDDRILVTERPLEAVQDLFRRYVRH